MEKQKSTSTTNQKQPTMYECSYVSGGGTEYEEGTFIVVRRTPKRLTLELVNPGFYCMYPEEIGLYTGICNGAGVHVARRAERRSAVAF